MKEFTRYIFLILICILLYMVYIVIAYKIDDYRTYNYIEEIEQNNILLQEKIRAAHIQIDIITSKAYKNKVLKAELGKRSMWEEVFTLIAEQKYNKYKSEYDTSTLPKPQNIYEVHEEKSLIATMSIYEKWIYLIFKKDTR